MAEDSKQHHHGLKDKILHPGKHHDEQPKVDPKNQTSAGAMKTEEQLEAEKAAEEKKKNSFGHKFKEYVAKDHERQMGDDIWSHYRGPGH